LFLASSVPLGEGNWDGAASTTAAKGLKAALQLPLALDKPSRSQSQTTCYWTYLTIIAIETGDDADDLHEFFKRKLLPPVIKTISREDIRLPASTTDLSKSDFTEYLDRIAALMLVLLPDLKAAGYLQH
jgi:hypothetical protein